MINTKDIYDKIRSEYNNQNFIVSNEQKYVQIYNCHFRADEPKIIPGSKYNNDGDDEYNTLWYQKYYDPIVYSDQYYIKNQYDNCIDKLCNDVYTRQAYISMMNWQTLHYSSLNNKDVMICTIGMQYLIRENEYGQRLDCYISMRSSDVVEYNADYKWQTDLYNRILIDIKHKRYPNIKEGYMYWHANTMQLYERDFKFLEGYDDRKDKHNIFRHRWCTNYSPQI